MISLLPDFLIDYVSSLLWENNSENDLSNTICLCSDRTEEAFLEKHSEEQCEWIQPKIPLLPHKDNPFVFFDLGISKETQNILNCLEWGNIYSASFGDKMFKVHTPPHNRSITTNNILSSTDYINL